MFDYDKFEDRKENGDNFDLQVKKDNNRENDQNNFIFKTGVQKRDERKQKAKSQKMYLMEAKRNLNDEWQFQVQGFSGLQYNLIFNIKGLSCSCPDFLQRKKCCKHIFFIVSRIAQQDQLLDLMKCNPVLKAGRFQILDKNLKQRLEERINQEPTQQEIDNFDKEKLGVEKDCIICFQELETKDLTQCSTCQKFIHQSCIIEWTKKNNTCPLCRQRWQIQKGDTKDAFSKLKRIKI
ncbi:hypothetical protein PPERSA_08594 [Pseudocohnilembus persalinus]|uniref:Uncharacterized protein n=1 Tax=Pseudocohnilembus persalinus TaxID=266149 RepID=A0A0V0R1M9_PSEPJ|nr:hypothetical protein PPERSA_08594 [Pseudocohnilembus persalinus]|eukprot:KRX08395.1 hypothetical protein PPERSA_08594 [Pseudocohnilembus persalinus]